jgi:hypothetical protein
MEREQKKNLHQMTNSTFTLGNRDEGTRNLGTDIFGTIQSDKTTNTSILFNRLSDRKRRKYLVS